MKRNNKYMKFVMEAADDAHLLDFGFPNKIQTYSTLKSWFSKATSKAFVNSIDSKIVSLDSY